MAYDWLKAMELALNYINRLWKAFWCLLLMIYMCLAIEYKLNACVQPLKISAMQIDFLIWHLHI